MRTHTDAHLDRVVEAIQSWLSAHPGAADNELGIAQWWLHDFGEDVSVEDLRNALLRLEAQGVMEMLTVSGVQLWRAKRNGQG